MVQSPRRMWEELERYGTFFGDCDDVTTFLGCAFLAVGIPVRFVAIRTREGDPEFRHVFPEVDCGSGWKPVDLTIAPAKEIHDFGRMVENL